MRKSAGTPTRERGLVRSRRGVLTLQVADKHGIATPEAWKAGDKVIVPPPQTQAAVEKRKNEGYEYTDWYFCKKDLGKQTA